MLGEKSLSEDVRSLSVSVSLKRNQTVNLKLQFVSTFDVTSDMPVCDVTEHGKISQLIPTFPKIAIKQMECNCKTEKQIDCNSLRRNGLKAGF